MGFNMFFKKVRLCEVFLLSSHIPSMYGIVNYIFVDFYSNM